MLTLSPAAGSPHLRRGPSTHPTLPPPPPSRLLSCYSFMYFCTVSLSTTSYKMKTHVQEMCLFLSRFCLSVLLNPSLLGYPNIHKSGSSDCLFFPSASSFPAPGVCLCPANAERLLLGDSALQPGLYCQRLLRP